MHCPKNIYVVFGTRQPRAAPKIAAAAMSTNTAIKPLLANAIPLQATPALPLRKVHALIMPEPWPVCSGESADSASRGAKA
jgi:hypothetical protein